MTIQVSFMLAVEDAAEAAEWYRRALGATELWSLGSVAGLEVDGAALFLHETVTGSFHAPGDGPTTVRLEVFTDDPGAFLDRAIEAGADGSGRELHDREVPWGIHRQGGFRDPFGHVWHVGDRSPLAPHPAAP